MVSQPILALQALFAAPIPLTTSNLSRLVVDTRSPGMCALCALRQRAGPIDHALSRMLA